MKEWYEETELETTNRRIKVYEAHFADPEHEKQCDFMHRVTLERLLKRREELEQEQERKVG